MIRSVKVTEDNLLVKMKMTSPQTDDDLTKKETSWTLNFNVTTYLKYLAAHSSHNLWNEPEMREVCQTGTGIANKVCGIVHAMNNTRII